MTSGILAVRSSILEFITLVSLSAWRNLDKVYFLSEWFSLRVHQTNITVHPETKHSHNTYCSTFSITLCIGNGAANCTCSAEKKCKNFAFYVPKNFRRLFHEICIAKILLTPSPAIWQNFAHVSYCRVEILRVRKKRSEGKTAHPRTLCVLQTT